METLAIAIPENESMNAAAIIPIPATIIIGIATASTPSASLALPARGRATRVARE